MKLILVVFLGCLFSFSSFGSEEVKQVLSPEASQQSKEENKRRKKVEICYECGKPETECDCEGHGNENTDNEEHSH